MCRSVVGKRQPRLNSLMRIQFHQLVKATKRSVGYSVHRQLRQTRCCDTFTGPVNVSRNRPGLYVDICNVRNIRKGIEAETLALTPGPHCLVMQVFSLSELPVWSNYLSGCSTIPSSPPTALIGWLLALLRSPLPVFLKACRIVSIVSSPPVGGPWPVN